MQISAPFLSALLSLSFGILFNFVFFFLFNCSSLLRFSFNFDNFLFFVSLLYTFCPKPGTRCYPSIQFCKYNELLPWRNTNKPFNYLHFNMQQLTYFTPKSIYLNTVKSVWSFLTIENSIRAFKNTQDDIILVSTLVTRSSFVDEIMHIPRKCHCHDVGNFKQFKR